MNRKCDVIFETMSFTFMIETAGETQFKNMGLAGNHIVSFMVVGK